MSRVEDRLDKHLDYLKGFIGGLDDAEIQTRAIKEGESMEAGNYLEMTEKLRDQITDKLKVMAYDLEQYLMAGDD